MTLYIYIYVGNEPQAISMISGASGAGPPGVKAAKLLPLTPGTRVRAPPLAILEKLISLPPQEVLRMRQCLLQHGLW